MKATPRIVFCGLMMLSALASSIAAQGLAQLVGSITDPSGSAVPGANVTVTEVATGSTRSVVSGGEGFYAVPSLRPAVYKVTVEAPGFRAMTEQGLKLEADQAATVNFKLQLGAITETVSITANAAQVDVSTGTIKQVVDGARIVELPLNGRNAATLSLTVAGAVLAPGTGADQGQTKSFPGVVTVSTNGSRQNQTSFKLDGVNNFDSYSNVNAPFPFPDALQEFSVQTSNYSAEYGQNAGGVVNVITKSGTNQIHGDAFEFVRNAKFNARNFFAADRDQLKRNQYGGTVGGPVVLPGYNGRDKTFFFFGYQGTQIRNLQGGLSSFVPTPANLAGDFSAIASATDPANPLQKATTIIDPVNNQPFPGNRIPVSRFDPAALAVTKYLPIGSAAANGLVSYSKPVKQKFGEEIVRIDHAFSTKDRLSGRYFLDDFDNTPIWDPHNALTYADGGNIFAQNSLIQETHIFSPALINDVRLNFSRENTLRSPAADVPSVADFGVNLFQPPAKAIEGFSVTGFFSFGDNPKARFTRNNLTLGDDLRWTKGRHNLAFGFSGELARFDLDNQFQRNGSFGFTSDATNYAVA
ncbi:MAG: carboxypeptidase regulatory-like domain-containing protein, partial [Acidobacteriota bacterium]|nr:carboxypeptidase regulatory-like domain-containing protein [Acidobacteriota bacterium]